jgi:hypothetical protein
VLVKVGVKTSPTCGATSRTAGGLTLETGHIEPLGGRRRYDAAEIGEKFVAIREFLSSFRGVKAFGDLRNFGIRQQKIHNRLPGANGTG